MKDLTGQRFGKLVVDKYIGKNKYGQSIWLCKCDCGNIEKILGNSLKSNRTKSCGCLYMKHGHSTRGKVSRTYRIWQDMKKRCTNINHPSYKDYGGRGITICERWINKKNGYKNFLKDIGEIPQGLTLDRIDNNKLVNGYSPENCRLATPKEQGRNKRNNKLYYYDGEEQCVSALVEEYEIGRSTLNYRLRGGQSIEEALTTPVRYKKNNKQGDVT